jgi:hypothetical protein
VEYRNSYRLHGSLSTKKRRKKGYTRKKEKMNYTDLYTTLPRHINESTKDLGVFFCNLYSCIKNMYSHDSQKDRVVFFTKHASKAARAKATNGNTNIMDSISRIYGDVSGKNIITISGDWGIYKDGSEYVGQSASKQYRVTIPELDSVLKRFDNWFCPHLEEDIHEKIYPIPINVFTPDWQTLVSTNIEELREIKKDHLCYANFSMTSHYRVTLATWIAKQDYIDYLFPKRFDKIDADVEADILSDDGLSLDGFATTLSSYKFAIAPIGNGIDTHRLWECILTNTVPIVQDTFCNRVFSKIWPMIIVGRYEFSDIKQKMCEFSKEYGDDIEYDYSLLLKTNFEKLLERLKHESDRVRRERAQMEPVKQIVIKF